MGEPTALQPGPRACIAIGCVERNLVQNRAREQAACPRRATSVPHRLRRGPSVCFYPGRLLTRAVLYLPLMAQPGYISAGTRAEPGMR